MDTKRPGKNISTSAVVGALVVVVVVVVVGFLAQKNVRDFENTIVNQTQKHLLNVAESKARSIEALILNIQKDLQLLAENPVLQQAIVENTLFPDDSYNPEKLLYEYFPNQVNALYRLDADGTIQNRVPFKENRIGTDYSYKPGIKAVMENHKPYISELFKSTSGILGISICQPVFEDKTFIGIVRVTLFADKIYEMVSHIKVGKKGYAWIINDEGIIVSHPVERFVGQSIFEIKQKKEGEVEGYKTETINQMLRGSKGSDFFVLNKFSRSKAVLSWAPIKIANELWSVAVLMDYDEIAGPVKSHTRKLSAAAGVLIVIFVVTVVWFYRVRKEKARLAVEAQSAEKLRSLNEQLEKEASNLKQAEEELQRNVSELEQAREAALNMMEDAEQARKQLKAANQQLQVTEQQLRVTNRQLEARNQQLSASEEKISQQNKFLNNVLESLTYPFYVVDANDYTIKMANNAANFSNLSEDSTCYALTHKRDKPCDDPEHLCPVKEIKKTKKPVVVEHVHYDKDGNPRNVEVHGYPIFDSEGNISQIIEYSLDITERKKAEDSLKDLNKELQSTIQKLNWSNQQLQEFTYVASHDLREPTRKIFSFGQLLQQSLAGKLNDDELENLNFMIDGAYRMQQMVEALLVYSRVSTKGRPFEEVDLNEIIEQLKSLELAITLEETGGSILVPEPLPLVKSDPAQIQQLLQNLISNALKYHREGVLPEVIIRAHTQDNGMVRIEVEDNGIGIKEERYDDVFVMFRRLHPRQAYEGTGIGLAICKRIIERHKGEIGAMSTYGQGSTFWFTLPRAETLQEQSVPASSSLKPTGGIN